MADKKFYVMTKKERIAFLKKSAKLSASESAAFGKPLPFGVVDNMVENVVGIISIPLGIATNFVINGKERLVPMAIEEPSVVAAASNAAKMARVHGGFTGEAQDSLMIGQVQVVSLTDSNRAMEAILASKDRILARANEKSRSIS